MIGHFSVLAAVLTVAITLSLSLLSLLCLRCRRKSTLIQEENQVYHLQTFQRGGSVFAVTQSKTVTRANQITSNTDDFHEEFSQDVTDDQGDYENVSQPVESLEHTYVAPIPHALYENTQTETDVTDVDPGVYANFIQSLPIKDDDDDYENSDFLEQLQEQECEEPDYVNELGECT